MNTTAKYIHSDITDSNNQPHRRRAKINIRNFFSAVLLLLFIYHFAGTSLFYHLHSGDGFKITHSHPYSGTPTNPNHCHTDAQLHIIAQLSQILLLIVPLVVFAFILVKQKSIQNTYSKVYRNQKLLLYFSLRSPPATAAI
ncbi:MAG: hypothetical protein LBT27_00100 [Prevotellaceae bacterium]|jgi:hypothetical protein|nr:hypothetical protein [Prevotellaceae bacterium]